MMLVGVSCKSKKAHHEEPAATVEYPRPASDSNLDSLKKVLDQERAKKLLEKKTE